MNVNIHSSGWYIIFCAVVLFISHGLRDYLITALPGIVSVPRILPNCTPIETSVGEPHPPTFTVFSQHAIDNCSVLVLDEGWTNGLVGGVLSSIYWGRFLSMALSQFIIGKVPVRYLASASLSLSGFAALFTALSATNGAAGLFILRFVQGFLQGWSYPVVFHLLEGITISTFVVPYLLLFFAPWMGSGFGALIGWSRKPFIAAYFFGSSSIVTAAVAFFVLSKFKTSFQKPASSWRECLHSKAVWSCVSLQFAVTWMLHLFIVGLSFTLQFKLGKTNLVWMVFVLLVVGGLVSRFVALAAISLLRIHVMSAIDRRRTTLLASCLVVVICLIVNGVCGTDNSSVLFGVSVLGMAGVCVALVGIRLNLHDLGPLFPNPFLVLGSAGASLGAGFAYLIFPVAAKLDRIDGSIPLDELDDGSWVVAWVAPIVVIIVICVAYQFLISVIPLPHQTIIDIEKNCVKEIPTVVENGTVQLDIDTKSFKSLKSALSFKTADSKNRVRTLSFRSLDGNEVDLHTIADSEDECFTAVPLDDDGNEDMKSVISVAASFKTAGDTLPGAAPCARDEEVVLSAQGLDRTAVWLTMHHTKAKVTEETATEKENVERNVLIALQW